MSLSRDELEDLATELKLKIKEQDDLINTLRKDFLQESHHLREVNELQLRGRLRGQVQDYLNVQLFSFLDGMDPKVVNVLNIKLG